MAQMVKRLSAMRETWVRSLGWEDLLEKAMAPHSSILAGRIPWMEEPGGLQSMGWQRVGHDSATNEEGNGTPLQYSCLENPMDGGAWWATVHGAAKSRTRLKRLSSSSFPSDTVPFLKVCCFIIVFLCYAMLCYAKSL